ncbi:MAG: hypothetical protein LBP71_00770 [Spirochaetaceae bacterium]|nr:hypothetical protein [Spirochaetaceae bacterium]
MRINAIAMSMASYIALAARTVNRASKITVCDNSVVMIHNPWGITGNSKRQPITWNGSPRYTAVSTPPRPARVKRKSGRQWTTRLPTVNKLRDRTQGIGVYFLIVKISLNSQKFSRKTNYKGE